MQNVLLINPWIHDFSTYDLWIQPLGLLYLAGVLEENGFEVSYINCLDAHDQKKSDGRGKFTKQPLPTPEPLRGIRRQYGRYGIPPEEFRKKLSATPNPSAILVTSGMTYWYCGVQETIRELRTVFPHTRIFLGGIYATLMPQHAQQHSGADHVFTGQGENQIISLLTGTSSIYSSIDHYPLPAWHLAGNIPYRVLYTSRGCPYRCTFCASDILNAEKFLQRSIESVVSEVKKYYFEDGIREFVFYDDALLINHRKRLQPILRTLNESGIQAHFHTPNGLNAREIDADLAERMYRSGFRTIRLSLESTDPELQKTKGNSKITNPEFERAIRNLYRAGYQEGDIECYLIMGLPEQTPTDVHNSLRFVSELGVIARLATFSPIPGTAEAKAADRFIGDIYVQEPLLQNHSYFPLKNNSMTDDELQAIKDQCSANNHNLRRLCGEMP
jgi:molybdenum cofactor biosynthesis enzyme MoaA